MSDKNMQVTVPSRLDTVQRRIYAGMDRLIKKTKSKSYLFLCFLVPIVITSIVYAVLGIFPYGNHSVLTLDMNGQYVYFFEQFREILTGKSSLFYSFERSLGGEFLGNYTYYLSSPLSLIVALFPASMITEAIMVIMILKTGFAGLTFSIYLDRTKKKNVSGFVMFSTMYALCSFATVFQSNTMWMDALIWLPLITLGIESIIKEGKFKLFTISLAFAIWSNYYIGYMICIFVVIYFLFYILSNDQSKINPSGEKYHFFKSTARIGVCSIIAVMMAGAVVVSAYYSLQFGKSDLQQNSFDAYTRFDILDLLAKTFFYSFDTIRAEGTPNIYAGTLILLLIPVYFFSKKVSTREKIGYLAICAVFVFSMTLNTLDLVWHGFQMPIWLNYRYSFMLSFLMLLIGYKGFEHLDEVGGKFLGITTISLLGILMVIQKNVFFCSYGNGYQEYVMPDLEMIWGSILLIFAYFFVILALKKFKAKQIVTLILVLIVGIEAYASTLFNWTNEVKDAGWASRSAYRDFIDGTTPITDTINLADASFFRFEKTFSRKPNDNLALDIRGVSEFTSTFNEGSRNLLQKLGFYVNSQTITYVTGNELAESLLGIKYVIQTNEKKNGKTVNYVSDLYSPVYENEDFVVYYNEYALPIAFAVDSQVNSLKLEESFNTNLKYTENIFSKMLGKNATVHDSCLYSIDLGDNIYSKVDDDGNGTSYFRDSDTTGKVSMTMTVTASNDGDVYMFLPSLYNTPVDCYINGKFLCTLFQNDTYKVQNIGQYEKGMLISVKLTFDANRIYLLNDSSYFYQYSATKFKNVTDELKTGGLNVISHSDTKIEGTMENVGKETVFTTIPYDKCWNVTVDGQKVDTYMCIDSMLAFTLPDNGASEHYIVIEYVPYQWIIGMIITVLGIGIFVTLCILDKKYRRKKALATAKDNEEQSDAISC